MIALENRKISVGNVFLCGLLAGAGCYLLSELLTPQEVATPGDHDLQLANRLGFIYTPVVGIWLGWLQRSLKRAALGALCGAIIGAIYMALCASRNFFQIMVAFPCLLGGGLAAVLGSNRSDWLEGFGIRLGKGLLAGLVLGFVYMIALNIGIGVVIMPQDGDGNWTREYISRMWRAGPIALGLGSALFFVLIRWAVGLTGVRLVFEEANASAASTAGSKRNSQEEQDKAKIRQVNHVCAICDSVIGCGAVGNEECDDCGRGFCKACRSAFCFSHGSPGSPCPRCKQTLA